MRKVWAASNLEASSKRVYADSDLCGMIQTVKHVDWIKVALVFGLPTGLLLLLGIAFYLLGKT